MWAIKQLILGAGGGFRRVIESLSIIEYTQKILYEYDIILITREYVKLFQEYAGLVAMDSNPIMSYVFNKSKRFIGN